MSSRPVFIYAATYGTPEAARGDYQMLRDLHHADMVGTYDVAIITKDADGKVHVEKHEKPTQRGAWTGVAVGAIAGILFPPSIIGAAAVGGTAGGLIGHFARGMSRSDMKELGDLIDSGQAAMIVVGVDKVSERLDTLLTRRLSSIEKETEADSDEVERELKEAETTAT